MAMLRLGTLQCQLPNHGAGAALADKARVAVTTVKIVAKYMMETCTLEFDGD